MDKDKPTQVGRALAQLGIELQKRLPQELRLAGITDMDEANRFLKESFLPAHNARFAVVPEVGETAFVPFAGALGISYACTNTLMAHLPSSAGRAVWRVTTKTACRSTSTRKRPRDPLRRAPALWTSRSERKRAEACPQSNQPQLKRSIHLIHKPVNLKCSRQRSRILRTTDHHGMMLGDIDPLTGKS